MNTTTTEDLIHEAFLIGFPSPAILDLLGAAQEDGFAGSIESFDLSVSSIVCAKMPRNGVAELFQITDNVGRDKNGVVFVPHKIQ